MIVSLPVERQQLTNAVVSAISQAPVVALLGPRQSGKTTLARAIARTGPFACDERLNYFDLEDPVHLDRLATPRLALDSLRGLIVIDEIQRRPDLFPVLRVLADREGVDAHLLILGSASRDLIRQGSETLAGRIRFVDVLPFALTETGTPAEDALWLRGGFPRSFLAESDAVSWQWREDYIRTFLERDVPALGLRVPPHTLRRFWMMLAHYHGQTFNASEIAASLGVADTTASRYLDVLAGTFMVRRLTPWFENIGKRQVKSPKVYVRDSGLLHTLLDISDGPALERHPKVGASWEGFMVEALIQRLGARPDQCYFWATHTGAELDLLVVDGRRRYGFEIKRTTAPGITPSMKSALADLGLTRLDVIHAGGDSFPLAPSVRAVSAGRLLDDVMPL